MNDRKIMTMAVITLGIALCLSACNNADTAQLSTQNTTIQPQTTTQPVTQPQTTEPAVPPVEAVKGFQVQVLGPDTVLLTWEPVANEDDVTFLVYEGETVLAQELKDTEYTVKNLKPLSRHSFRVRARRGEETGVFCEAVEVVTNPAAVTDLTVKAMGVDSLTVSWGTPDTPEGASLSYRLYGADGEDGEYFQLQDKLTDTTFTETKLSSGQSRWYKVSVDVEIDGVVYQSELSDAVEGVTQEPAPSKPSTGTGSNSSGQGTKPSTGTSADSSNQSTTKPSTSTNGSSNNKPSDSNNGNIGSDNSRPTSSGTSRDTGLDTLWISPESKTYAATPESRKAYIEQYTNSDMWHFNIMTDVMYAHPGHTYGVPFRYPGDVKELTWTSDDTSVLEIDSTGLFKAKKEGTATVTMSDGVDSVSCVVYVYDDTYAELEATAKIAAQDYANSILTDDTLTTDLERITMAAYIVNEYVRIGHYSQYVTGYNQPYGTFVTGWSSCAGNVRALGLILEYMGFEWYHVNEGQYDHQWCVVYDVDGKTAFADGASYGVAGYGSRDNQDGWMIYDQNRGKVVPF